MTEANLNYVGSLTLDEDLMDQANLIANEKVQVVNINNGARFETYLIEGARGSRTLCLNGAAARCAQPGDIVIVISYGNYNEEEAKHHTPVVVLCDGENNGHQLVEAERPFAVARDLATEE